MGAIAADLLFAGTAALYLAASGLFVAYLTGRAPGVLAWGPRFVAGGAALHATHVVVASLVLNVCPVRGIHFFLSVVSMLSCVAYLAARAKWKLDVVGAFVAPLALTFLLASRVAAASPPSAAVHGAILPIHVLVNLLGEALFTLAFAAAVVYLVAERRLKQKRLGGVFERLPPLDALDRAEHGFLLAGFPLLTVGILTGTLWAHRVEGGSVTDVWRAAFGYATWALFAAVLLLRAAAGWRGRRAAYGTIAGFGFAVIVLLIYLLRSASAAAVAMAVHA